MAASEQGPPLQPISRTQHRPLSSSDDAPTSRAPPSCWADCAPALAPSVVVVVPHSWPHCHSDTRLTSTSIPVCSQRPTLSPAVYEVNRRDSKPTRRRYLNVQRIRDSTHEDHCSAPAAHQMHPHSFDSCNAGWTNEDAAGTAGLELGHERSGTLHMPPTELLQTRSTLHRKARRIAGISPSTAICALLAGSISTAMAQSCISLADSTACQAFGDASISTASNVAELFPFLSSVDNVATFDSGIASYIAGDFTQQR